MLDPCTAIQQRVRPHSRGGAFAAAGWLTLSVRTHSRDFTAPRWLIPVDWLASVLVCLSCDYEEERVPRMD